MNFQKALLFITLLCLSLNFSFGQNRFNETDLIPVNLLQKDLDILQEQLDELHIGLYDYTPKQEMEQAFQSIRAAVNHPMTAMEFYQHIVTLHGLIKNGHTIIQPTADFDERKATVEVLFPFDVYWDCNQLYVLRNLSEETDITAGSMIKTINGESAATVFLSMSSQWTRDGYNEGFADAITYRAFGEFYANFKGLPEVFELEIMKPNGQITEHSVQALTNPTISQNRLDRYGPIHHYWQNGLGDPVTLDIKGDVAILAIKTCSSSEIRKFGKPVKAIFREKFKAITQTGVKHLIIDLRNNGGGEEIAAQALISHLVDSPFKMESTSFLKTNKLDEGKLYAENSFTQNLLGSIGTREREDGYYEPNGIAHFIYNTGGAHKWKEPAKIQFKGQIYTLTNPYTFSAAGFMASWLKQHTNSIFIGEETGGGAQEIIAGHYFNLCLPHSKNRVMIPVVKETLFVDHAEKGRGVIPDHQVRPSIKDKLARKDVVLDYTNQLILGGSKPTELALSKK